MTGSIKKSQVSTRLISKKGRSNSPALASTKIANMKKYGFSKYHALSSQPIPSSVMTFWPLLPWSSFFEESPLSIEVGFSFEDFFELFRGLSWVITLNWTIGAGSIGLRSAGKSSKRKRRGYKSWWEKNFLRGLRFETHLFLQLHTFDYDEVAL